MTFIFFVYLCKLAYCGGKNKKKRRKTETL